jgi:hypothetical protein
MKMNVELLRPTLAGTLAELDTNKIDFAQRHWERRSQGARGTLAVATCQKAIKVLFRFLTWLDRQLRFGWRWPTDYRRRKPRIDVPQAELADRIRPKTYSVEQLALLYQYATPFKRSVMLLALNCGFGPKEVAKLQLPLVRQPCDHIGQHSRQPFLQRRHCGTVLLGVETVQQIVPEAQQHILTAEQLLGLRTGQPLGERLVVEVLQPPAALVVLDEAHAVAALGRVPAQSLGTGGVVDSEFAQALAWPRGQVLGV